MDPYTLSSRYQPELNQELRSAVSDSNLLMYHMMRYHMGWVDIDGQTRLTSGGKLLRPSLCLLACEAVGGDWETALPAAVSLELLHNFTLIHDDIEDGDAYRRGNQTVWDVWGVPQGINTGDAMNVLSSLAILALEERDVPPAKTVYAARLLHETALELCEGQFLDISFENRLDIAIDDYLRMIKGKTAALFGCSLKLGALLGSDDDQSAQNMYEFGLNLGMAFQIQDDILGIWGEEKKTGKSCASDIRKKKKTLPIIHALSNAPKDQVMEVVDIYTGDQIDDRDISIVIEVLEGLRAREYCRENARRYMDIAIDSLDKSDIIDDYKEEFVSLAAFIIDRDY